MMQSSSQLMAHETHSPKPAIHGAATAEGLISIPEDSGASLAEATADCIGFACVAGLGQKPVSGGQGATALKDSFNEWCLSVGSGWVHMGRAGSIRTRMGP